RPDAPAALVELVARLMARDPAQRYQTPADLVVALDGVFLALQSPAQPAPQPPTPEVPAVPAGSRSGPPSGQTGRLQVLAHPGGVKSLSLSSDGLKLLTGGLDETLRLWAAAKLRELGAITGDVGPVNSVGLGPGAKWAASCALRLFERDMVVQLWDVASGSERRRLKGHTKDVRCLAIAPDGRRVAAGGDDQTIPLWAIDQTGSPSVCLRGHTGPVYAVAFLTDGASLLSGGGDGTVRLWDVKSGTLKGTLQPQ